MTAARKTARGLAWFGIGLGLAELLVPAAVAKASGLEGRERLLRLFGLREIASGVLLLAVNKPERWLWVRVAGDALDGAVTAAVAPVVALDVLTWLKARGQGAWSKA